MPITRKPKAAPPAADETAVQELISKGGSVAVPAAVQDNQQQLASVLLRIPSDMLAQIDASVKRRLPVRISRQSWIIEALRDQLAREGNDIP
jgi:hypothetical protein